MKEIKLTRGQVALVDDEDFEELNQYAWHAFRGQKAKDYYAMRTIWVNGKSKHEFMHRHILKLTDSQIKCDHKDGNRLNNQRENLRTATSSQNEANKKKKLACSSTYKGVCWDKRKQKWIAYIRSPSGKGRGRRKYLGYFTDEIEAAIAYNRAAEQIFGQFALLNVTF